MVLGLAGVAVGVIRGHEALVPPPQTDPAPVDGCAAPNEPGVYTKVSNYESSFGTIHRPDTGTVYPPDE